MKHPGNIHDAFFKSVLSDRWFAVDFLKTFLPAKIGQLLDFRTLTYTAKSYISEGLAETFSDCVFEIRQKGDRKNLIISILLEHKSSPEKNAAVQILQYISNAHSTRSKERLDLQPVLPVLFYHGNKKWKFRQFENLLGPMDAGVTKFQPLFETVFIDISMYSDDQISGINNVFLASALYIQKYAKQIAVLEQKVNVIFGALDESHGNLLTSMTVYFYKLTNFEKEKFESLIYQIPNNMKTTMMSTWDHAVQEGIEKGFQQGVEQGVEQGIEKGEEKNKIASVLRGYRKSFSIEIIASFTGLSEQEVVSIINEHEVKD